MTVSLTALAGATDGFRAPITVPFSAGLTLDCAVADIFDCVLTGNVTLNLVNGTDGQKLLVRLKQDVAGGRTLSLGSMIATSTDIPGVALSTAGNKIDLLGLIYKAGIDQYQIVAYTRGF